MGTYPPAVLCVCVCVVVCFSLTVKQDVSVSKETPFLPSKNLFSLSHNSVRGSSFIPFFFFMYTRRYPRTPTPKHVDLWCVFLLFWVVQKATLVLQVLLYFLLFFFLYVCVCSVLSFFSYTRCSRPISVHRERNFAGLCVCNKGPSAGMTRFSSSLLLFVPFCFVLFCFLLLFFFFFFSPL